MGQGTTGRQLEKYTLVEEVGQGGMAVVYRGHDTSLDREVAVKILHPHLADQDESKRRFQREAQAVAKLRHDNILEIYDYSGLESDESYIVTEFIRGHTLKAFLARHPISHPEIAAMIIAEVAGALAHAHAVGIIHRDIKPENIMIRADGRVKLMDFGIAQIVDMQQLTVTGQLLGSPAYMAPELVEGGAIDFRADIFSVGTLLYQLATSELPFRGKNPHEVLKRIADCKFVAPEVVNPLVGDKLGNVIRRALARTPADRYRSVVDLREALMGFLADADIDDPRAELVRYFDDPADYSRDLQVRVVAALTARGKKALERGESAKALGFFDRVLCADPRNAEVLALLDQIARRRRLGRVVAVLALVALVGGGAYVVSLYWPLGSTAGSGRALAAKGSGFARAGGSSGSSAAAAAAGSATAGSAARASGSGANAAGSGSGGAGAGTAVAGAAVGSGGGSALAARPGSGASAVNATGRRPGSGRARAARKGSARSRVVRRGSGVGARAIRAARLLRATTVPSLSPERRVEIIPTPKAVTVFLNDRKLGPYGPDLRYVTLPTGQAKLVFRNLACCFDRTVTVGADKQPKVLRVRLKWKPARVRVLVEPESSKALVVIGKRVGSSGQTFEVPIPASADTGRSNVDIKISAEGYRGTTQKASVRANGMTTVRVKLLKAKKGA